MCRTKLSVESTQRKLVLVPIYAYIAKSYKQKAPLIPFRFERCLTYTLMETSCTMVHHWQIQGNNGTQLYCSIATPLDLQLRINWYFHTFIRGVSIYGIVWHTIPYYAILFHTIP